jgi:5'(3')-deoxyribonucleotidase
MHTIFLDMDGVVADFDKYTTDMVGVKPSSNVYPDHVWAKIAENKRLYRDLPICADARYLVENVLAIAKENNADVLFLTAVPKGNDMPWAFYDKIIWTTKYFPNIPVWFGPYSNDKKLRAGRYNILIDDRSVNIKEWIESGGHGILYKDAGSALDQLRKIFDAG